MSLKSFPKPSELAGSRRRRGLGKDLPVLPGLPGQAQGTGGRQVLVLRQPALAHRVQALRDHRRRIRGQVPGPVQRPAPDDPQRQRHRIPRPPRLPLHVAHPGAGGPDRRPRAAVRAARRPLLPELGPAPQAVARQGQGHHRRDGDHLLPQAPGRGADGGHPLRQGQGRLREAAGKLRPADPARLPELAVPLRVPEPGLHRLPGLLQLLQAGLPQHPGPVHRHHGAGRGHGTLPPGRRAQAARQARRRTGAAGPFQQHGRRRRHPGCHRRRPGRGPLDRPVRGRQGPVVQLHRRQRLLRPRQVLERAPGDPAGLHRGLHPPRGRGPGNHAPGRGPHRRTRPHHRGIPRAARRRKPGPLRRQARARRHRLPVRGEPQLLHRALDHGRLLAQDPRAVPHDAGRGLLDRTGRPALPGPQRGPRRALRPRHRLGRRRQADRPGLLARGDRAPPRDRGRAQDRPPGPGAEHPAGIHHRTLHPDALGHHHRAGPAVAGRRRRGRRRRPARHGGLARRRRRPGPRHHRRGPALRGAAGRDPRRHRHRAVLGPDLRQDQGHRHGHRRHDEPRGHRLPRIRPAGRDRNRLGLHHHQDRPAAAGGRHQGHRPDPRRRTRAAGGRARGPTAHSHSHV